MKLKINGISSLTDARYCAGMGVSYLAVELNPENSRPFDPSVLKAIQAWIEGVEWIGIVRGNDPEIWDWAKKTYELDTWQIEADLYNRWQEAGELRISDRWCIELNQAADWDKIKNAPVWALEVPEKLGRQLDFSTLNQQLFINGCPEAKSILALHHENPDWGFSLNSTVEEKPGWMDLSELQTILEDLEDLS